MRRLGFLFRFVFVLLLCGAAPPASAARRIALVMGNGNYLYANTLTNPVNDAGLLAGVLQAQGFEVTRVIDADQRAMKRAFSDFAAKLQMAGPDTVALVYYAGHGVQFRGANYLIPVDAKLDTEAQLEIETFNADTIMQAIGAAGSKLNIVILDACRNTPFRSFRSASRGLAAIDAPQGTLVAFSTAPGQAARDGCVGRQQPLLRCAGRGAAPAGFAHRGCVQARAPAREPGDEWRADAVGILVAGRRFLSGRRRGNATRPGSSLRSTACPELRRHAKRSGRAINLRVPKRPRVHPLHAILLRLGHAAAGRLAVAQDRAHRQGRPSARPAFQRHAA